jgi:hypothetical protein
MNNVNGKASNLPCAVCHERRATGTMQVTVKKPSIGEEQVFKEYPVCRYCAKSLFSSKRIEDE